MSDLKDLVSENSPSNNLNDKISSDYYSGPGQTSCFNLRIFP